MQNTADTRAAIAGLAIGVTTSARKTGAAKLTPLFRETVAGMPTSAEQEIRVLFATLEPGDRTPYHSHRFPVTVYILTGAFTLELDDRPPVTIRAGEAFVEPAGVRMTGRNLDAEQPTSMAIFYVCNPDTPFADPV
ncbi:putative monooxygenase [Rhizobiaceae bacterium]|nr:putative monooxygenase [Rhizobiaceae bacterium]